MQRKRGAVRAFFRLGDRENLEELRTDGGEVFALVLMGSRQPLQRSSTIQVCGLSDDVFEEVAWRLGSTVEDGVTQRLVVGPFPLVLHRLDDETLLPTPASAVRWM